MNSPTCELAIKRLTKSRCHKPYGSSMNPSTETAKANIAHTCFAVARLLIKFLKVNAAATTAQPNSKNGNKNKMAPAPWAREKPSIWGPDAHVHAVSSHTRRPASAAEPQMAGRPHTQSHIGGRAAIIGVRSSLFKIPFFLLSEHCSAGLRGKEQECARSPSPSR